jgi:hypothetical protein
VSWLRRRKISPLPISATPLMIAAVLLDKVQQGEIDNVVVCWKTKAGGFNIAHSEVLTTDILMHEKAIQQLAMEIYTK